MAQETTKTVEKKEALFPIRKIVKRNRNTFITPERVIFTDGKIQHRKFEIGPYGEVKIVDGELEDRDAFIQSNKENAGAYAFICEEMAKNKTLDQIIAEGNEKIGHAPFVDVSGISGPMSASEVEARIAAGVKGVEDIASQLGITPEAYVKMSAEEVDALIKKVVAQKFEKQKEEVADGGDK